MRYLLFCSLFLFFSLGCSPDKTNSLASDSQAQEVVDKAIRAHGGKNYEHLNLAFDFRDRHYTATRNNGLFTYTRAFTDSTGRVKDFLNNDGFKREVNGQPVNLPEERKQAFTNSVNSVIYFALLPFGLNDPAVQKAYLGEVTLRGQPYHKVKITFAPEGGGVDHEDEFIYYIHQKTFVVDYFAYSYQTEGGGLRFRQAYNPQVIGGIRFQQYINFEPPNKQVPLTDLDKLFEAGQLKELSRIELENIQVNN
ncbi:hypothetical protein AAE02nite_29500 [Adhaeribacter aerolatus]|uniref:Deoxyribose-phosphate aldolase n=1 Tax=Adhaeribacter aerolatus TaxID=670289 RepID=A0A512B000_9BACT|nr:DUF6503 family protein [Adhaeribacter aerolatus]GEO05286.1 hypothetical protein AAE02nite_29500 [Adhaeribacter aerolatus]